MDYAIVEITLERLPSERLKRNVVRGKLDLVGKNHYLIILFNYKILKVIYIF